MGPAQCTNTKYADTKSHISMSLKNSRQIGYECKLIDQNFAVWAIKRNENKINLIWT